MEGLPLIREELVGAESQHRSRYADFPLPISINISLPRMDRDLSQPACPHAPVFDFEETLLAPTNPREKWANHQLALLKRGSRARRIMASQNPISMGNHDGLGHPAIFEKVTDYGVSRTVLSHSRGLFGGGGLVRSGNLPSVSSRFGG